MSRCFPFPPPGYEKKTTTDDLDLLKKEKQKEKHKKEKKDKEKREGKEKRDKDKGDGKHREKKDKKEKSRDKKKDKDRDRGKDKSSNLDEKSLPGHSEGHGREISTEKRFPGQSETHNGEKVSNDKRSAGRSEGHNGERVSYEQRLPLQSKIHSEEKFIPKEEKDQRKINLSNERSSAGQFGYCNGGKVSRGIPLAENAQDSKFTQELDRRVREESRGTANHIVDKFTDSDQKRDERILNPVGKATVNGAGGNEKKDKRGDGRKIDEQGIRDDTRFSGNSMVENFSKVDETRVEGIASRPLEANIERKMEGKEKTKEKGDDDKRRDKHKDRDKEKKSKGKDKDRDKERKKEEKKKAKQKKENKTVELDQVKESMKNDIIGTLDVKAPCLSEDSNKNAASAETLRKRKHIETNGFLHADESRPNKMARPTLSSHSLSTNGRILDPCQTLIPSNSDRQGAATNLKVDGSNDQKVNGVIEAQPASFTKLPLGTAKADPMTDASKIPLAHPDSKYLSQILSVPKIEDLPDTDEQEWLFSGSDSLSKKCELGSVRDNDTPMVWSEAVLIASADVYALPYVLPY